jgi:hypothetical protein
MCNVPDLASLGSAANVCKINHLHHINDHTNNKCDKGLQSLYYDISVEYKGRMQLNKTNHLARSKDKRILAGIY